MGVMGDPKESFCWSGEVCFGSCLTLEAPIQSTSPAHCVLADSIAQEEVAINAEIIATFSLIVISRVNFSIDYFLDRSSRIFQPD